MSYDVDHKEFIFATYDNKTNKITLNFFNGDTFKDVASPRKK